MNREMIYQKINEIFRDVFDDEELVVSAETTAADIEGWDSLVHVNLVISIEKNFDIKFKMEEFSTLRNVGAMVELIETYVNEK